jgi:ABC-type Fe3+ transport system substrate-binding protein
MSGEFPIFFPDCGDYEVRKAQRVGAPLGHIIPKEAGGVAVWPLGIPKNSARPNAARLFVTFMLTREGQDFVWDSDGTDYWRLPGSKIAPEMEKYRARGVKFIDQTQLESDRPELLKAQTRMFEAMQQGLKK